MTATPKQNRWMHWVNLAFSLCVTVGVFAYLFSHITWSEVVELILNSDRAAILLFLCCSMTMNVLRTYRYHMVLKNAGHKPPPFPLFLIVIVRGLFVDLLPARLGELIYIYLVRTRLGIPLGVATASFALPFIFDLMALAPLILIASVWMGASVDLPIAVLAGGGAVLLAGSCAVLYSLPFFLRLGYGILNFSFLQKWHFIDVLKHLVASIDYQVKKARRAGLYGKLLGVSLLVRVTKYASLYLLFYAMTHPHGYNFADLPIPKMFIGFCSAEMVASLPISGIAGFGAYEGMWVFMFGLLGFPEKLAQVTAVSHHLFTQIYGYLLGVIAFLLLVLPGIRAKAQSPKPKV